MLGIQRRPDGVKRRPLIFHPAGVFFALAAVVAAVLPWLWLLPLTDPGQAHVRLGIFGFGGMAVSGYLLTAQRAWTGLE
ncbi:MAG: NnrS family protein [Alphaproteobacteria bacterium]|nr:NnrS family protein [Alphaproteobacteria bacterium]